MIDVFPKKKHAERGNKTENLENVELHSRFSKFFSIEK